MPKRAFIGQDKPKKRQSAQSELNQESKASAPTPQALDVVKFKDLMVIKKGENVQMRFTAIADYLLNHSILLCGAKMYRLVELEFYMVSDFHQDCYTHRAPEQKENLVWYFHRVVPGIDLTFGGGEIQFGGVLLRSVEDLSDGSLIEGTSNVLGLACRNNGCSSKEGLVLQLAPGLAAVQDDRKLEDFTPMHEAQTSGSRVLPPKVKAQLSLIHDRSGLLSAKTMYSCPRVSLGVKNTAGLAKYQLLMAHYRFLTELRHIKAGKPNIVLGLRRLLGWTADDIADATGCKLETVEKYIALLATPTDRTMDKFPPCRSLALGDYCALYQLVHGGDVK